MHAPFLANAILSEDDVAKASSNIACRSRYRDFVCSQHRNDFMAKRPTLTTDSGMPVSDNQNSITAGPRGPGLMQDFLLFQKLAHHKRRRIPQPRPHPQSPRAHGTLATTHHNPKKTKTKGVQK